VPLFFFFQSFGLTVALRPVFPRPLLAAQWWSFFCCFRTYVCSPRFSKVQPLLFHLPQARCSSPSFITSLESFLRHTLLFLARRELTAQFGHFEVSEWSPKTLFLWCSDFLLNPCFGFDRYSTSKDLSFAGSIICSIDDSFPPLPAKNLTLRLCSSKISKSLVLTHVEVHWQIGMSSFSNPIPMKFFPYG